MKVEEIRGALKNVPFRPFLLSMGSGAEVPVNHPEFVMISPSGRSVYVVLDSSITPDGEEYLKILDTMLIEAIVMKGMSNGDAA